MIHLNDTIQITARGFATYGFIGTVRDVLNNEYLIEFPDRSFGMVFDNEIRLVELFNHRS